MILQKVAANSRQNKCLSINMSLSDKMADSKEHYSNVSLLPSALA